MRGPAAFRGRPSPWTPPAGPPVAVRRRPNMLSLRRSNRSRRTRRVNAQQPPYTGRAREPGHRPSGHPHTSRTGQDERSGEAPGRCACLRPRQAAPETPPARATTFATMELWEQVALGAIILLVLLWQGPALLRASRERPDGPRDWMGALIPIGLVVLFVLFLISMI